MNYLIKPNYKKILKPFVLNIWLILLFCNVAGQTSIEFNNEKSTVIINDGLEMFEDVSGNLTAINVIQKDSFELVKSYPTNFGISNSAFWLKLTIVNSTLLNEIILGISNPLVDEVELYEIIDNQPIFISKQGDIYPFKERIYNHQQILFNIKTKDNPSTYLLRIKS